MFNFLCYSLFDSGVQSILAVIYCVFFRKAGDSSVFQFVLFIYLCSECKFPGLIHTGLCKYSE